MSTEMMERPEQHLTRNNIELLEKVVVEGDLSRLTPQERVSYYARVCDSLGLNPYTQPFGYIVLNGKLTLYAKREAAEQLRALRGISITKEEHDQRGDLYIVRAYGRDKTGREDVATGAVSIAGLKGDALANAVMKAETKAKRRLTLSLAGLGWLDESEVDSIPDAKHVKVDPNTGEIQGPEVIDMTSSQQTPVAERAADKPGRKGIKERIAELIDRAQVAGLDQNAIKAVWRSATGKDTMRGCTHADLDAFEELLAEYEPDGLDDRLDEGEVPA